MYTIFKNENIIFLTDELKLEKKSNFYFWKNFDLKNHLINCNENTSSLVYLHHPNLDHLFEEFENNFITIEAAGGVVQNSKNEILFIYRNDKWDLPKGKAEKGETISETAIREVQEECGINKIVLKDFIMKTFHIYVENGQEILKLTHWYKMFSDEINFKPQMEEGITNVVWKNIKEVKISMENTYPNIKLLIEKSRN